MKILPYSSNRAVYTVSVICKYLSHLEFGLFVQLIGKLLPEQAEGLKQLSYRLGELDAIMRPVVGRRLITVGVEVLLMADG